MLWLLTERLAQGFESIHSWWFVIVSYDDRIYGFEWGMDTGDSNMIMHFLKF